jgi:hypothetical protein
VRLLHNFGALIPEHQRQLVPVSWTLLADPHALCALRLYFVALNSGQPEMSDAEGCFVSEQMQMNKGWMSHVRCHGIRTLRAAATWEKKQQLGNGLPLFVSSGSSGNPEKPCRSRPWLMPLIRK